MTGGTASETVLVVGFGNPLMGDDGFGAAVIGALSSEALPEMVTLGTTSDVLHLADRWRGQSSVWLVDIVMRGACPGTVHRLDDKAVRSLPLHPASAHHLSFGECLRWLLHATPAMRGVKFRLWGAEPASLTPGAGFSKETALAVEKVAREILREAVLAQGCQ